MHLDIIRKVMPWCIIREGDALGKVMHLYIIRMYLIIREGDAFRHH